MSDARVERVFCITYCRNPSLYYGTSLIFKTIRLGFPDAEIVIIDNASAFHVDDTRKLAESVGASFFPLSIERGHQDILADIVYNANVPTAVVDPDIVFWDRADESKGMLEGRLIPDFLDPYTGCHTHERLHTSFLKFRPELRDVIADISTSKFDWDPFVPIMLELNGWHRWDTMSCLYTSIKHLAKPFDEGDMNKYDHLFCGSHIDLVAGKLQEWGDRFRALHESARTGDIEALRGAWKLQDTFFNQFSVLSKNEQIKEAINE
jgi:hypothetical protein